MATPTSWADELGPTALDQATYIIDAFAENGIGLGIETAGGGLGYLYAERQLLVREPYLRRVLEILRREEEEREPDRERDDLDAVERDPEKVRPVIAGVVLLTLSEGQLGVPEALNEIDRRLGRGIATPNHVLTVQPEVSGCPATEPQQVYDDIEPFPSACQDGGGQGVLIYLADTGLLPHASKGHPWLAGVRMGDAEDVDSGAGQQPIPPYTAHGTFVAGVTRCVAPGSDIIVTNAFAIAGSTLESDLVPRLVDALGLGVDIFHLTIAAPTRYDLPLIAFEAWLGLLRQYKGVVVVVAAGNAGSRRPEWPGAFSEVVSVGALGADWRGRASFSNFGGWVDVYAPGRELINAYTSGTYECQVAPYKGTLRHFYGMAKWSGTSFSTPIVTGLIAARMSRTGENGQEAARALLAEARAQAIPGVGAILLPRCDGERCRPADRSACGCQQRSCRC
ncbi:MAG TPA: S8/S53 family peptidase [Streptosporangiaceae bacterium]|nr:S8/S53 family peptidase [Streptosporangiaceae bacterium]